MIICDHAQPRFSLALTTRIVVLIGTQWVQLGLSWEIIGSKRASWPQDAHSGLRRFIRDQVIKVNCHYYISKIHRYDIARGLANQTGNKL